MGGANQRRRIVIMGAAGRDFHNFNVAFRDRQDCDVVAFTAAQIPDIAGRRYPPALAGALYPAGIPIVGEDGLAALCRDRAVDEVVFAYSDVSHETVMHRASVALAAGADFTLLGPRSTMIAAPVPVIAVCAVRTGVGKSPTTRWLSRRARTAGLKTAVIRHPMPYGDLTRQAVQRFASAGDLDAADCTVEEREEYEPHLALGNIVYAGVDYAEIVARAAAEADLILWDGGNNDFPFVRPDLLVVLADPLRPGDEARYHPGEATLRMADHIVVAKTDIADPADIAAVERNVRALNPEAALSRGRSPVTLSDAAAVRDRRVLVVEDGPTITHGGMSFGAGFVAARAAGAASFADPRDSAAPAIAETFARYPHIGTVLPAMGYGASQLESLAETIRASDAEIVVSATPCDLARLIDVGKRVVRATYEFEEAGPPVLAPAVDTLLRKIANAR